MEEKQLKNISSAPHVRSPLSTGSVMYDVVLALVPATIVGIWHFGLCALLVTAVSIITAVLTEFIFDYVAHKPNTIRDGSAIVTGLLLALVLPPAVPLYIPLIGSIFAILFVKCFFGGLGKNIVNPALGARCLLLISFGTAMTDYSTDTITGATPLGILANGGTVTINQVYLGQGTGIIGACSFAVLLGGIYLLAVKHITWEIPVSMIGAFALCELALGQCAGWQDLLIQIFAGGIMLGAFFMATDPVTSPMTERGQLIYGAAIGILCSIFRVYGSSQDSVSYAIIFVNLCTPLIDLLPVKKPMGVGIEGDQKELTMQTDAKKSFKIPKAAMVLCAITLISGILLAAVNFVTRDRIAEAQLAQEAASYLAVLPDAASMGSDDALTAAVEALNGEVYGTDFGNSYINAAYTGLDASGAVVGYAFSVTTTDSFDSSGITVSVGIDTEGTVTGIAFTSINETAGMGMNADTDEWKAQFAGKAVDSFILNKSGGASADNEINSVSGASITSGAVVNAVNAVLDFYAQNVK